MKNGGLKGALIMKRYKVEFNKHYFDGRDVFPKGEITVGNDNVSALKTVHEFLDTLWKTCCKEPYGKMKYPFLVPGGFYADLWDWDSFFMACAVPEEGYRYAKGSIQNLLEGMNEETGAPAKKYGLDGSVDYTQHPYPLQIQFAYIMAKRTGDMKGLEKEYPRFERVLKWYEENTKKFGFYVWNSLWGNGIDNNPSVYGRMPGSSAGVDLASFHYRELMAMRKVSEKFAPDKAGFYAEMAHNLKKQICEKYFDCADGMFYNIDLNYNADNVTNQKVGWVTHLKFKSWASLFPLWAGAATSEQAKIMRDRIMSEEEYLSCCGIRSHSKNDMVYNNEPMGNPSNWQGPVWGLSTFVTAYGLARYGYKDDALEVAYRLIRTFAADIEQNKCIHEAYSGETGQPLIKPGFVSWNMLAYKIIDDIENGKDCTTEDILC